MSAFPGFSQPSVSQCIANIQKQLDDIGPQTDCSVKMLRTITKEFDFGDLTIALQDPRKAAALKRVFTSLSEFCHLAGNHLSAKGMRGYARYSGGIIRSNGIDFVEEVKKVFGYPNSFDGVGFNGIMEHIGTTGAWLSQGKWRSAAGLVFDMSPANRQGHRMTHVFTHTVPQWNNRLPSNHSVFSDARQDILIILDEAWRNRPTVDPADPGAFLVDMGRVVGTNGERKIMIIVRPNTSEIITAYPQP